MKGFYYGINDMIIMILFLIFFILTLRKITLFDKFIVGLNFFMAIYFEIKPY